MGGAVGTVQMLQTTGAMDAAAEPVGLIAAAADGDLVAFEHLYRQFAPRVYGLCLRLTGQREAAEDCTQESFVAAWRALGDFQQRSRFSTWLHRIAVNTVLARRRGLRVEYEVPEPKSGLPEGARHVLVLVGIYGFSHAEAARTLGVAEGTCKAQLHRARGLLTATLGLEAP
jgi:RNA polymerase sigma-70 factor (ECF subfamily)